MPRDFPLALDLQYQIVSGLGRESSGLGRTTWMSSKEVIFETEEALPLGAELEIAVRWPILLEDRVKLQLWVRAEVVNTTAQLATAAIRHYQFRTCRLARAAAAAD